MRILVTGASSFTGKQLVKLLHDAGHQVFFLVRTPYGQRNEILWDFQSPLPREIPPCESIIHLAAYVDFGSIIHVEQYTVNTVSTLRLAVLAKTMDAYFILASMAGVHGSKFAKISPDTPIAPENHYAISKYLAEEAVKACADNYSILRIGGMYGLDGPKHLGLNTAISDAVNRGQVPTLQGSGRAMRNYICILDVITWIDILLRTYETAARNGSASIQETLYVAGTEVMSIRDYLQAITDVVLPGKEFVQTEGKESGDMVIIPSTAPFTMRSFKTYLLSLVSPERDI